MQWYLQTPQKYKVLVTELCFKWCVADSAHTADIILHLPLSKMSQFILISQKLCSLWDFCYPVDEERTFTGQMLKSKHAQTKNRLHLIMVLKASKNAIPYWSVNYCELLLSNFLKGMFHIKYPCDIVSNALENLGLKKKICSLWPTCNYTY